MFDSWPIKEAWQSDRQLAQTVGVRGRMGRRCKPRSEGRALQSEGSLLPPGLCVLVVEDEPLIAIDGEAILRSFGVSEVVCVRTVADGHLALDARLFHAAFLDLRLGQDSSIPLAQRLASLNVPFGFLTGFQGDAIPDEFKSRPILIKPFTPDQLGKLLRNLIGQA